MNSPEDEIAPVELHGESAVGNAATSTRKDNFEPFTLEPPTVEEIADQPESAKFSFSPEQLCRLVTAHHPNALAIFGGIRGLATGLRTDLDAGLSADEDVRTESAILGYQVGRGSWSPSNRSPVASNESPPPSPTVSVRAQNGDGYPGKFSSRRTYFGENRVPKRKPRTFLQLLWLAFNDKLMFLLTGSAAISLALGIYQTIQHTEAGPKVEWVEGVAILVAVVVIVFATALNDLQKNRKFQKLNEKKEERMVAVTRSGKSRSISVFDVVVGDILQVEAGDVLPADGILIRGSEILCDESTLTGESELVQKVSATQVGDHLMLSGTKVVSGIGSYLVVAVGINSTYGKIVQSFDDHVQETPLQQKLGRLAKYIINFGLVTGAVFFIIQFSRFLAYLGSIEGGSQAKGQAFLEVLILAITLVVIVVPEGLPLTVTIALAFATTRMLKDNNLVRSLRSCETMGNATTICSDKTGTLTQNNMSVVAGAIGKSAAFGKTFDPAAQGKRTVLASSDLRTELAVETSDLLKAAIAINSTAMETSTPGEFIGSSTETSLLKFAQSSLGMDAVSVERNKVEVVHMVPFDSRRKWMAAVIKTGPSRFRLLVKGAAEVLLGHCNTTLSEPVQGLSTASIEPEDVAEIGDVISKYGESLLRVIALAFKDLDDWRAEEPDTLGEAVLAALISDLTFLGAFGIQDPLRPKVADSVSQCQAAGVFVRMVTGDSFATAKSIASTCGIYTPGGIALDGPTFRRLTGAQLDLIASRIQVMARSSPEDKRRLVLHLKDLGEVVAVTGDGTNDALALKCADIGFSMGLSGTEVAKEASDIILMDDNFASIVKAMSWGRAINDATKRFLQFQFTINITAGLLTIVTALVGGPEDSIFSVVQLLWINLIMDTFASLAMSTDYPAKSSLQRRPEPRNKSIINTTLWKMIGGQSLYQAAVMFTLHYAGYSLFRAESDDAQLAVDSLVFNTYVLMQFFNQSNCRRADNHLNIFEDAHRNPWFWFVQAVTLGGQLTIIFVGGEAFRTSRLDGRMWGWSILFAIMTWPLGIMLRLIPDENVRGAWSMITKVLRSTACFLPKDHPEEGRRSRSNVVRHTAKKLGIKLRVLPLTETAQREGADSSAITQPEWPTDCTDGYFNLNEAIDASRYGLSGPDAGFEVHPDTRKEDPILNYNSRSAGFPPSQDPELTRYMGIRRNMTEQ